MKREITLDEALNVINAKGFKVDTIEKAEFYIETYSKLYKVENNAQAVIDYIEKAMHTFELVETFDERLYEELLESTSKKLGEALRCQSLLEA